MERKSGYYWVKFLYGGGGEPVRSGDWEVAEFHTYGWALHQDHDRYTYRDDDFSVIGPRIEPPADSEGEPGR